METRRRPKLVMVLTENWTICSPRDLRQIVRMAAEAEAEGVDAVMLSEHLVLGASAGALGRPDNPREYAAPGNQAPETPWPDSIVLGSAIASATTRLRIVLGAIIAPLRHPIALAHQLAALDLLSEGRLVVQPTVSWHPEEYAALGVPWSTRGARLDEHLAAWSVLWRDTPASFSGEHYAFEDVYMEPKPARPQGPALWFGGIRLSPFIIRRLVAHGQGFHPFGQPSAEELAALREAMAGAGRSYESLEVVGGLRPVFETPDRPADVASAFDGVAWQIEQGYNTFCFNPSQYVDDVTKVPALCRQLVSWTDEL
jgi:alkanesulfonate monooxygenase SsuD/methylene tetrahydromethanopterin reductase-like flavin-dependent oxidoreductase (luciferase family)